MYLINCDIDVFILSDYNFKEYTSKDQYIHDRGIKNKLAMVIIFNRPPIYLFNEFFFYAISLQFRACSNLDMSTECWVSTYLRFLWFFLFANVFYYPPLHVLTNKFSGRKLSICRKTRKSYYYLCQALSPKTLNATKLVKNNSNLATSRFY